jgi:transcriptional regulator with GAF, ATPase, and Fis domain
VPVACLFICQNAAMNRDASGDQYAEIARCLSNQKGLVSTIEDATSTAVDLFHGCDHASLSLLGKRGKIINRAQTDVHAARADELQVKLDGGPCVQAAVYQETVHAPNLLTETRWPTWSAAVATEMELRSVLALNLYVNGRPLGALNMYSHTAAAFEIDDRVSAKAYAAHVAVAVSATQYEQQTEVAMGHRLVIGQAEGMLMQALGVTEDQAFAALTRVSQNRNVKLTAVAADIVKNGIRAELFD